MKKVFTLFFALFLMAFCAKAQVAIFSENFDSGMPAGWTQIDANNDGYGWEHSSNPVSYFPSDVDLSGSGHNSSTGFILSGSYSNVTNLAITPDNWLITPAITLTGAANLSFWVCGQDANYSDEHYGVYISTTNNTSTSAFTLLYEATIGGSRSQTAWENHIVNLAFYTGQTVYIAFRHFNCNDMFLLDLDDVEVVAQPTDPTISATPTAIDFGTVTMPGNSLSTATVTAYNLTAGITATTAAPFAVSADGTTYGTTATIAQAGGTLYLKYTPTAAGSDNGIVTLSSTGATSVTLTLTGSAVDCSNTTLPYTTNFTNEALNNCWTIVDANNDGDPSTNQGMWNFMITDEWAQYFYHSTNAANDWLISPVFNIPQTGAISSFDYKVRGSIYPEKFSVWVIPANGTYLNATQVVGTQTVNNTSFETQYVDLTSYAGQSIQIAIKAESDPDMFGLNISNFFIGADLPTTMTVTPSAIDFGTLPTGMSVENMIVINSSNLNEAINVTTANPFSISLDGNTYTTTITIPANTALNVDDTVYVKFSPTAAGTFNGNIIVSTTTLNDTVVLMGTAVSCSAITTFPFTEDFEETSPTLPCWTINDANNDGSTFSFYNGAARCRYHSTNNSDDWLISPEITFNGSQLLNLDYYAGSSTYSPEKFVVAAINGTTITPLTDTIVVANTTAETEFVDLSSLNGTYRIGIHCVSDADMLYLYIDNFSINNVAEASLSVSPDSLSFVGIMGQASAAQEVAVTGLALTSSISVSAPANFEVSADNLTFGPTATIANTGLATQASLYVRINATTAGTHSGNITLTSGTTTASIYVEGNAVDCSSGIASLPFTHNFNDAVVPPMCWDYDDAAHFGVLTVDTTGTGDYAIIVGMVDYLITPEIHSTTSMNMSIDYLTYAGMYQMESSSTFRIGYSSTNNTLSNFTWLTPVDANETTGAFSTYTALIPAGTKYIAIDVTEIGTFYNGYYPNYLFFDNFTLTEISDPVINASTTNIDFGSINVNTTETETVTIISANLTAGITATTTAPFQVSADNTTFGATATIPATGGSLYVRYAPTAAGTHTGNVTLASTGATSLTINLTGRAFDCSGAATLPFVEDFEGELSECWLNIDADGDGFSWYSTMGTTVTTHSGDAAYASASYDNPTYTALTPNNWLITPAISIPATGAMLTWWVAAQDANYAAEHYQVMVSTTGTAATDFTSVFEETLSSNEWAQKSVALTSYANQTIHIAFVHNNCTDMFVMKIDDISVTELSADPTIEVNPTAVAFGNLVTPNTDVATVNVTAYNLTADIAISTAAPYTVSTDGINYNTTATMTQPGGVLYIQYAPIAAGSYNGMVNLTSGTANATITLTGTATEPADCNTPASLPFFEGFEGEDVPDCWTTIDADGDGHDWYVLNNSQSSQGGFVVHSGEGHITSASYASGALTPDNWLITPQIAMGTNGHLSFWAAGQDPSYAAEVFSVYLSTTGPATTDFTVTLLDHQTTTGTMTEYTADLSAYAGQNIYIAFRHHDVTDMFRLNLDDVTITGENSIANVESNNISVYPNPANNVINVNSTSNISNVEIYTIAGQKVGDITANSTNTTISTANLTTGLYLMKIHTDNGVINKKFSVAR